jgi:hypothetical protein
MAAKAIAAANCRGAPGSTKNIAVAVTVSSKKTVAPAQDSRATSSNENLVRREAVARTSGSPSVAFCLIRRCSRA